MVFGEVGLSGEVRAVSLAEQRLQEAVKLGFTTCVMPRANADMLKNTKNIKVIGVSNVQEAIELI